VPEQDHAALAGELNALRGKPQCHILAMAKDGEQVAISVGCMLSRVRTGMSNTEMSCAIPAARLGQTVEALRRNAETERAVAAYAAADAARFAEPAGPRA
jgi:uncharacterized protein (DUF169 family)